ncbi:hypothetical protein [Haloechinothrix salitolerans]|uniref:CBS domain-containing protein n=1 Tax=Haloechinothrix salitolerans TaxID=926830 RepID=A0ABW2C2B6_9PSEU
MVSPIVFDVMATPLQEIGPDAPLALAARRLVNEKVRRLLAHASDVDGASHTGERVVGVDQEHRVLGVVLG